ncbi:MAG TPA: hypothetical protein VGG92_04255 [Caulobacteraceae bacterium]|jgi:hypothetical protein
MRVRLGAALAASLSPLLFAAAVSAQPMAPAPALQGVVASFIGDQLTVRDAHGVRTTVTAPSDARFLRLRPIDPSAIRPGSFVATANVSQPDGSGRSTEFRVFAPALRGLGEGHGPMAGEAAGTMMTNGTVSAEVVSTPRGRELDISYGGQGGGVRHVVIPPNVTIREMSVADRADAKAGVPVEIRAGQAAGGRLVARAILIGETSRPAAR